MQVAIRNRAHRLTFPNADKGPALNNDAIWKERFGSLVRMLQDIPWSSNARDIYQQIATELIGIVRCDSVNIRLLALTGDEMVGYVYAGAADELARKQFPTLPMSVGRMSDVFTKLEPLIYDFNAPDEHDVRSEDGVRLGYSHAVIVPLLAGDAPVGAVDFMFKAGQFDDNFEVVEFLTQLGRLLGSLTVAIETTVRHIELKTGEEARRIGSELHDNFAQPLSVIALEADKATLAQEEGDGAQLAESLDRISNLSRQSFGMMSEEVALLHSAAETSEDLNQDIKRYVENFEKQWGIRIQYHAPLERTLVSHAVGNQAMRILHEALSNVLRHARCTSVGITLAKGNGAIELCIEDDGCGFNVREESTKRLGLKIMEERANSVGGRLTIASVIGEGTSVCADLPLMA